MSATMTKAELLALANEAAELGPDMNEAVKGGGGARLLPEGYALGRLIEYVELGNHAQEFQGKAKEPALEVQLGFALWGQGYQNEDGTPYIIRPYSFSISRNEKARAFLLFKAMNWKLTAKSFAQLLGDGYLVKIVHEAKSKTDATVVSRIDLKGFLPPHDQLTRQPYPIPDVPDEQYRLFMWNRPTKAGWDALHVDGKYDDGKSKNFVQEKMMAALDFQGSPLQQLLFSDQIPALPVGPAVAPAATLPPGAGYAPMTPTVGGVAPAIPLVQPTQPVIAAAIHAQVPVATAGPVMPTVPTPAVTPIASTISPTIALSSPAMPTMPQMPAMPGAPV